MTSRPTALDEWFDRLFTEQGPAMRRLAAGYSRTPADADDLFQDVWLAIWRALPRFRGDCSDRTFVFRIAHNRGITHRTRTRWRREETIDERDVPDPSPDPAAIADTKAQRERLVSAIRTLPVAFRDVVTLSLEGLSNQEIAEVLGMSYGNVGVRLTRARRALKQCLEQSRGRGT